MKDFFHKIACRNSKQKNPDQHVERVEQLLQTSASPVSSRRISVYLYKFYPLTDRGESTLSATEQRFHEKLRIYLGKAGEAEAHKGCYAFFTCWSRLIEKSTRHSQTIRMKEEHLN